MLGLFTNRFAAFSAAIAVLLLASGLVWWLASGSLNQRPAPINISRADYNGALAKWNSSHASEYEETVNSGGRWKLVVTIDRTSGNDVESVTHYKSLDGTRTDDLGTGFFQRMTVGEQFREVDTLLKGVRAFAEKNWQETGGYAYFEI